MNGILIVAHGSKIKSTDDTLLSICSKIASKTKDTLINYACFQFSLKTIDDSVEALINQGVTNIKVIPLFLFDGLHVSTSIPLEINKLKEKYPKVTISLTKHIGDDDKLCDIILDRIN